MRIRNRLPNRRHLLACSCALFGVMLVAAGDARAQTADLAVTKTVNNATPSVGGTIIFTINLVNNGPASATGVTGTDLLPAGLTFVAATPSQGSYTTGTGLWTVGTLAASATATLVIQATVATAGAKTNTVTVTANETDPDPTNNSASATVTPPPSVPTLPPAALILLMGLLAALAVRSLRRRAGRDAA